MHSLGIARFYTEHNCFILLFLCFSYPLDGTGKGHYVLRLSVHLCVHMCIYVCSCMPKLKHFPTGLLLNCSFICSLYIKSYSYKMLLHVVHKLSFGW